MTTACFNKVNGLIASHAYTVIGVNTVTDAEGQKHRLVKCRNPWGRESYSGKWSDKSKLWTPELRKQVDAVVANDGVFYIPVEEYKTDFSGIYYTMYDESFKTSSITVNPK